MMTPAPASMSAAPAPRGDADMILDKLTEISRERSPAAAHNAAFALIGVALEFIADAHGPEAALRSLVPYAERLDVMIAARRAAEPKITPSSWI
jgi:hypothetical protein